MNVNIEKENADGSKLTQEILDGIDVNSLYGRIPHGGHAGSIRCPKCGRPMFADDKDTTSEWIGEPDEGIVDIFGYECFECGFHALVTCVFKPVAIGVETEEE